MRPSLSWRSHRPVFRSMRPRLPSLGRRLYTESLDAQPPQAGLSWGSVLSRRKPTWHKGTKSRRFTKNDKPDLVRPRGFVLNGETLLNSAMHRHDKSEVFRRVESCVRLRLTHPLAGHSISFPLKL